MRPEYIVPDWPVPENIASVVTTRIGGCSGQVYQSLNLGEHVKDDKKNVYKNRQIIKDDLQLPNDPVWLEQVHGARVLSLNEYTAKDNIADAAWTNKQGTVCAVLTADCLPVIFCDVEGENIAVAHAGWRGLVAGVLENTLQALPSENNKVMCWLGPAIGPNKFEVGEEVFKKFTAKDASHQNAFQPQDNGKHMADICQLAKNILTKHSVRSIYGGEHCTYSESDKFFSYRREGETGRMATLIFKK